MPTAGGARAGLVVLLDVSLMSLRRVESVLLTHANFDRRAGALPTFLGLGEG